MESKPQILNNSGWYHHLVISDRRRDGLFLCSP